MRFASFRITVASSPARLIAHRTMAKRCVLVAFAVAGAALAAPSQRELSQEPRAGWLHKAHAWLCSRHPQHRWCQHSGQQDKEALPSQQEEDILQEDIVQDPTLLPHLSPFTPTVQPTFMPVVPVVPIPPSCGGDCKTDADCPSGCDFCAGAFAWWYGECMYPTPYRDDFTSGRSDRDRRPRQRAG
jgi:hypothetical protein